jgi:hypothetical protein
MQMQPAGCPPTSVPSWHCAVTQYQQEGDLAQPQQEGVLAQPQQEVPEVLQLQLPLCNDADVSSSALQYNSHARHSALQSDAHDADVSSSALPHDTVPAQVLLVLHHARDSCNLHHPVQTQEEPVWWK